MATIIVNVDGEFAFEWRGDAADIRSLQNTIAAYAAKQKRTPVEMAGDFIGTFALEGWGSQGGREAKMAGVIGAILVTPTNDPVRPGKFGDYVEAWNFTFDLSYENNRADMKIVGMEKAKGSA